MSPNEILDAAFPYPLLQEDEPEVEALLAKYFFGRTSDEPDPRAQQYLRTADLFGADFVIEYISEDSTGFIINPI